MSSPLIQEIDNLLLLKLNELPKHDKNWRNLITGGLSLVISIHQNDQLYFWITIWRKHLTSTNLDLDFAWGTNKQKYYSPVLVDFPLGKHKIISSKFRFSMILWLTIITVS